MNEIIAKINEMLLSKGYESETIQDIGDIVTMALKDYELTRKVTAIVVSNNEDVEIVKKYFVAKASEGLSPRSLTYYHTILTKFFSQLGKHVKDVTADDVRCYIVGLKMRGCSGTTCDNERRVLSSFFGWASDEEILAKNIVKKVGKVRSQKKIRMTLTEDELESIRSEAGSARNEAIIETLYSTGCRCSELCSINIEDVNFEKNEIVVVGKGNKCRIVYLSARCIHALKKYLSTRNDGCEALFVTDSERTLKGSNPTEFNRVTISSVETMIRKAGRRAGIEHVHPHMFRRTAATLALKRGMPIEQVQQMLGHEDIKSTTIYAQVNTDSVKQSHQKYII